MSRNITVGIDVGTHTTRVVVLERERTGAMRILGTGSSESRGLRHGYITNVQEASISIARAVTEANQAAGIKIKNVVLSLGGISLSSVMGTGETVVSRADGEITDLDLRRAIAKSEAESSSKNRRVIETIPIAFRLDGNEIFGRPVGMRGQKLEVRTVSITCLEQHFEDLVEAATLAGLKVTAVIPSAIAASYVTASEKQKVAGCALVNIGAETVTVAVFENGTLFSLHVFSIGSTDITNDIALGLKIPLDEAESVKLGNVIGDHPKKQLDEIIEARLIDIFELIEKHLKRIKRHELLPAGIIFTGGGAHIHDIVEFSKKNLNLPARIGEATQFRSTRSKVHDPAWFVSLGLCLAEPEYNGVVPHSIGDSMVATISNSIKRAFRQLLP